MVSTLVFVGGWPLASRQLGSFLPGELWTFFCDCLSALLALFVILIVLPDMRAQAPSGKKRQSAQG